MPRPANPQVRSRLLASGAALVRLNGFNATGVQDIATAAGVPKGSFYSYFDSKEAFAVEILDEYWTVNVSPFGAILTESSALPLKRVERYFAGLTSLHEENGFTLGCLIGNLALEVTATSEEVRGKLIDIFREWTDLLAACLNEAQARHEIPTEKKPAQVARALIEAFEGAVMQAKIEQRKAPLTRFQKLVLPSLLA